MECLATLTSAQSGPLTYPRGRVGIAIGPLKITNSPGPGPLAQSPPTRAACLRRVRERSPPEGLPRVSVAAIARRFGRNWKRSSGELPEESFHSFVPFGGALHYFAGVDRF